MMPMPERAAVLIASGIQLAAGAQSIDLAVRPGEIVGLAGLEGHGQEGLLETLCGLRRPCAGTVTMHEAGSHVAVTSLAQAARLGIAYLPRDRRATGILPGQSVFDNFAIAALPSFAKAGFVRRKPLRQRLAAFRDR